MKPHLHDPTGVESSFYFIKHDELHEREKPYAFRYDPGPDVQQSNFVMEKHDHIRVEDMRDQVDNFSLDKNGFCVMTLPDEPQFQYDDFYAPEKLQTYFRLLEVLLKDLLGASHVEVFRHGIRKRDASFPISTGKAYDYDQPTSVAHVDTTAEESLVEVRRQHGDDADRFRGTRRVQWINTWKPLRGPLNDWPLAVCDSSTIDPKRDLAYADLLYPDLATENCQVYYHPDQKWYYLRDHAANEVMVFRQSDTSSLDDGGANVIPGVVHSSFYNPLVKGTGELPRESIEARALAYYG